MTICEVCSHYADTVCHQERPHVGRVESRRTESRLESPHAHTPAVTSGLPLVMGQVHNGNEREGGIMTSTYPRTAGPHTGRRSLIQRPTTHNWATHPPWDVAAMIGALVVSWGRIGGSTPPVASAVAILGTAIVTCGWLVCYRRLGRLSGTPVPGFSQGFPSEHASALQRVCLTSAALLIVAAFALVIPTVWRLSWSTSGVIAMVVMLLVSATRLRVIAPRHHLAAGLPGRRPRRLHRRDLHHHRRTGGQMIARALLSVLAIWAIATAIAYVLMGKDDDE